MIILTKNYHDELRYNSLLLLSIVMVIVSIFFVYKSTKNIMLAPAIEPKVKIQKSTLSVAMRSLAPVPSIVKEEIAPPKQKVQPVVKKTIKPIEKKIETPVIKKLSKVPAKEQEVLVPTKEVTKVKEQTTPAISSAATIPTHEESLVQEKTMPVDENIKAEYMAGLYRVFAQHKHYPKMAKRRGIEGVAHIHFRLLKNGKIESVSLVKACGHKSLDKAAIKLVKSIESYKPIPDEVSKFAMNIKIPITYSLKESH
jgi:periplasmic protein TonB